MVKVAKSLGHLTWGEEQIAQYRAAHPPGTAARLTIELMLNIAARRGDVYQLGPQHVQVIDGVKKLVWRPSKTKRSTGRLLKVRILPNLQAAIDAMPRSQDLRAFLVSKYGRPFKSEAVFGNQFADWCHEAGLKKVECDDGKVRSYRAHGLRKASCVAMLHAGCNSVEIMAVSGHSSLAQLQVYIADYDRERMADSAMAKLAGVRP